MITVFDDTQETERYTGKTVGIIEEADLASINFVAVVEETRDLRSLEFSPGAHIGEAGNLRTMEVAPVNVCKTCCANADGIPVAEVHETGSLHTIGGSEINIRKAC